MSFKEFTGDFRGNLMWLEGRLDFSKSPRSNPPPVGGSLGNIKPSKVHGGGSVARGAVVQSDVRIRAGKHRMMHSTWLSSEGKGRQSSTPTGTSERTCDARPSERRLTNRFRATGIFLSWWSKWSRHRSSANSRVPSNGERVGTSIARLAVRLETCELH